MRDILFRGKRTDNGKWVYGLLYRVGDTYANIRRMGTEVLYPVLTNTIGQYTGLTDKNGKKIFEDDIIRVKCSIRCPIGVGEFLRIGTYDVDYIASVIFDDCRFCLAKANGEVYKIPLSSENIEVIGNTHDNQELLEEKE